MSTRPGNLSRSAPDSPAAGERSRDTVPQAEMLVSGGGRETHVRLSVLAASVARMVGRQPSLVVRIPQTPELTMHIATEGTLTRRAPSFTIPRGGLGVEVPPVVHSPSATGVLARLVAWQPPSPLDVRYCMPADVDRIGGLWRTCPTTGLELKVDDAHLEWFRRHSGTKPVLGPLELGVDASTTSLSAVAWWVLAHAAARGQATIKGLLHLSFDLDAEGATSTVSARVAASIAARWRIGTGLVVAAEAGRIWLNPRSLRWIARDLAAAAAAAATTSGADAEVSLDTAAQVLFRVWFPHLASGQAHADGTDVLMAAWFLQESFHGATQPEMVDGQEDLLGLLTALAYSAPSTLGAVQRLDTWASIWTIGDDQALAAHPDWSGLPPSQLRTTFERLTSVTTDQWFGGCLLALLGQLAPVMGEAEATVALLPDNEAGLAIAALIEKHLTCTVTEFGESIVAAAEHQNYAGFGSSAQSERSPLHDRPVVAFDNGSRLIVDATGFVRAVCHLPRKLIVTSGAHGNHRRVSTSVGYMFEAHVTEVLSRLDRCDVIDGEAIDASAGVTAKRGDVVVSDYGATVALEIGLMPLNAASVSGSTKAASGILGRYAAKMAQALATTVGGGVATGVSQFRPARAVGHFVVVDEPMAFTALHCARIRQDHPGLPELFVVGVDDIARLVDLAASGASFPTTMIAWQQGGSRLPFDHHLASFEHIVGLDSTRIQASIDALARTVLDTTATAA